MLYISTDYIDSSNKNINLCGNSNENNISEIIAHIGIKSLFNFPYKKSSYVIRGNIAFFVNIYIFF